MTNKPKELAREILKLERRIPVFDKNLERFLEVENCKNIADLGVELAQMVLEKEKYKGD